MEGPVRDDVRLIETFGWTPAAGFARLEAHLARLARGAAVLGVPLSRGAVEAALARVGGAGTGCGETAGAETAGAETGGAETGGAETGGGGALRVRLTVDMAGGATVEVAPAPAPAAQWRVRLAAERLRSGDPWLGVKTTRRAAYDAARAALPAGIDEAILLNERGEVCDGTITTVFLDQGDGLRTPPLACGVLPGVLRAELLASGAARAAVLRPTDLGRGRLWVGNALRGLIPAVWVGEA